MNSEQIKQGLKACLADKCKSCSIACSNECQKVLFRDTLEYIKHMERLSASFECQAKKYAQENHGLEIRLKQMAEEMDNLKSRNTTVVNIYCDSLKGVEVNDQTGNH